MEHHRLITLVDVVPLGRGSGGFGGDGSNEGALALMLEVVHNCNGIAISTCVEGSAWRRVLRSAQPICSICHLHGPLVRPQQVMLALLELMYECWCHARWRYRTLLKPDSCSSTCHIQR